MAGLNEQTIKKLIQSVDHHIGRNALAKMKQYAHTTHQMNVLTGHVESNRSVRMRSIRVAQAMTKRGVKLEDVVMICAKNHDDTAIPVLASLYLGAAVLSLSVDMVYGEILRLVLMGKPKILFCDPPSAPLFHKVFEELAFNVDIVVFGETDMFIPFSQFQKRTGTEEKFQVTDFDPALTTAFIVCSSGTTGNPKGICLTHRNIVSQLMLPAANRTTWDYETSDELRVLSFSSMYWFTGVLCVMFSALMGYVRMYTEEAFTPDLLFNVVKDYKPKILVLSPVAIGELVKHPKIDEIDFSTVFALMCIGSPISPDRLESLQKRITKGVVINAYGLTESTGSLCYSPKYKRNSCGVMVPWVSSKIVDVETHKKLGPNEIGELWVKSDYIVFKGYYGNPDSTANAFAGDGWLRTGDLMYYDEEGFFYVVDRMKEMLKYRNYQVAPTELESVIQEIPGVKFACVVGKPHIDDGDLPMAFVETLPGAQITAQQVKDIVIENLSKNKQLRAGVVFMDKLPTTHSGKIDRKTINSLKLTMVGE